MKRLTIFTPTYNRGYCIRNLYECLKKQTNNDFLWLVVDDGSTDNTRELLTEFQEEKYIDIMVHCQKNGGKHVAHNKALELCDTELFVCVDSDDVLTENAVDLILKRYDEVKNENVLGLYMRKITKNGDNIASDYPLGLTRVGIEDLYHKYSFIGDTVIILKTELVKDYKFPVFPEERFVSESVFYNQLNDIAPMALFEDAIYICEYLPDGYTSNTEKLTIKNPYGSAVANLFEAAYAENLLYKIKNYSQYLALIRVFKLDKKRLSSFCKPNFIIRFAGHIILSHYIKLFERLRLKYE